MSPLLFADVAERLGRMGINVLAVAGAAAVGYVGTFFLIWLVCRLVIHKQPPKQVTKIVSVVGAVALGLLAAMLLFKAEGGGGGWGFGDGFGWGTGPAASTGPTQPTQPATTAQQPTTPTHPDTAAREGAVRVRMLGGARVKDGRFYLVDGDPEPLDFDAARRALAERVKPAAGRPGVHEVVIVIDESSVARDHAAVRRLEEFAKDERLVVSIQDTTKP